MKNEEITFSTFCDNWIRASAIRWKTLSRAKYESMLRNHIVPVLGDRLLSEINAQSVQHFSSVLLEEQALSVKMIRDILTLLNQILKDARKMHPEIPGFDMLYPKAEPPELRVLNPREQKILVDYLNQEMDIYRFAVLLALSTGLRLGEVCGLRWSDFSMDTEALNVRHTVQRIPNPEAGTGQKTVLYLGTPKTRHSLRTVPLLSGIAEWGGVFCRTDEHAFLLTGTERLPDPRMLQRRLKKYTAACGLKDVHFHTLRHTFATRCVEVGCDVKTLSEILGHSSIAMTMSRYVHPSLEFKRENIRKLEMAGFGCIAP